MDPITLNHQARLRQQEILKETGFIKKQHYAMPISFGIWRWLRRTIQSTIRMVIQLFQKQKRTEIQPCHDSSARPEAALK